MCVCIYKEPGWEEDWEDGGGGGERDKDGDHFMYLFWVSLLLQPMCQRKSFSFMHCVIINQKGIFDSI